MSFCFFHSELWEILKVFLVFFLKILGSGLVRWLHKYINGSEIQPKVYSTRGISDSIENSSPEIVIMNIPMKFGQTLNKIKVAMTSVGNVRLKWS